MSGSQFKATSVTQGFRNSHNARFGGTYRFIRDCTFYIGLWIVEQFSNFIRTTLYAASRPWAALGRFGIWLRSLLFNISVWLIIIWVLTLRWGEISAFENAISACEWHTWEQWVRWKSFSDTNSQILSRTLTIIQPPQAFPHHLVFVADPQLVDPHTYPGRPWPLSALTIKHTDLYLRRAYSRIQLDLHPQTIMFLGDYFDGGREWSTETSESPEKEWRAYGDTFWLKEYDRFSQIFFRDWTSRTAPSDLNQRIEIVASLPGNHDLGFATGVQIPVRDRFNAYFGESNRVDIIGNHTFVSLDTVSLSAKELDIDGSNEEIWRPAEVFIEDVKANIARTHDRYLAHVDDTSSSKPHRHPHHVEDVENLSRQSSPLDDAFRGGDDFPTILLTHVPLYRTDGTPCGPLREHHPPTPPPPGQTQIVEPDPRNAIFSSGFGNQYKNVLSPEISRWIVESLDGKVDHVFSGDDHDYCEVVHRAYPSSGSGIREITVKSISWAMGVRKPGFLMASLLNELDESGRRMHPNGASQDTLQTHLCLLPDQIAILLRYGLLLGFSVLLLAGRASTKALRGHGKQREGVDDVSLLPTYAAAETPAKLKNEDIDYRSSNGQTFDHSNASSSSGEGIAATNHLSIRNSTFPRPRSTSPLPSYGFAVGAGQPSPKSLIAYAQNPPGWNEKEDDEALWSKRKRKRSLSTIRRPQSRTRKILNEFVKDIWVVVRVVVPWYVWLFLRDR